MKRLLFLCFIVVCYDKQPAAQQIKALDTFFLTTRYNDFFTKYPSVQWIATGYSSAPFCESVSIVGPSIKDHSYNLKFEGDKYYFDQLYTPVASPGAFLPIPVRNSCDLYTAWYRIRPDTVYARISYFCPSDTDDMIFTKVEARRGYPKGLRSIGLALTPRLQDIQLKDSAFLFTAILRTDSTLSDLVVKKGNDAEAANRIIQVLKEAKPWIPLETGGRPVKAYLRIFVRIYPDRSARVFAEGIEE